MRQKVLTQLLEGEANSQKNREGVTKEPKRFPPTKHHERSLWTAEKCVLTIATATAVAHGMKTIQKMTIRRLYSAQVLNRRMTKMCASKVTIEHLIVFYEGVLYLLAIRDWLITFDAITNGMTRFAHLHTSEWETLRITSKRMSFNSHLQE